MSEVLSGDVVTPKVTSDRAGCSNEVAVRALQDALASLPTAAELSAMPSHELLELTRVGSFAVRRLEGMGVACAGVLDRRLSCTGADPDLDDQVGFANTAELVRNVTGSTLYEARRRVNLAAEVLPRSENWGDEGWGRAPFALVAAGLDAGCLTEQGAEKIVATVSKQVLAPSEASMEMETYLVGCALGVTAMRNPVDPAEGVVAPSRGEVFEAIRAMASPGAAGPVMAMHFDELRKACTDAEVEWLDFQVTFEDRMTCEERCFTIGREREGLVPIRGKVLPEVAATLEAMVNAITSPRTTVGGVEGVSYRPAAPDLSYPATASENCARFMLENGVEHGTPTQLRHDALATILNVAASSKGLPSLGGGPLTVMVKTTQEDLQKRRSGTVTTNQGQIRISGVGVAHATCAGAVQYYATNSKGKIIELGSRQRIFTTNQRRAILARDGGCVIPGCQTPADWCEIHHVTPHALGGATHTDNGVLLCYSHHRHIEANGWKVKMEDGVPHVRAPEWRDPGESWWRIEKHKPPRVLRRPSAFPET